MADISDKIRSDFGKFLIGATLVAALALGGCKSQQAQYGTLEGTVSIGPLCPVERIPPDPACLPTAETYKGWPIAVYKGILKFETIEPAPPDGAYAIRLPAGEYTLDLSSPTGIGSDNLPAQVTIYADKTTTQDINIDTGMR
jgi:hypothetical protein